VRAPRQISNHRDGGAARREAATHQVPAHPEPPAPREPALRARVHTLHDQAVQADDARDDTQLIDLVTDELHLTDLERTTAGIYVQSWRQEQTRRRLAERAG
jgi:hypothetical protein